MALDLQKLDLRGQKVRIEELLEIFHGEATGVRVAKVLIHPNIRRKEAQFGAGGEVDAKGRPPYPLSVLFLKVGESAWSWLIKTQAVGEPYALTCVRVRGFATIQNEATMRLDGVSRG